MQISVSGQQIDIGEAMRNQVEERIAGSVAKYFGKAIDAQIVFSLDGGSRYRTHIRVHVGKGMEWESHADDLDIHISFSAALEHIEKQLRRYKRKKRDHHRDNHSVGEAGGFADQD